jgi:crotonobetainyl-CoA:carnitine CoA-transferase CaiB-like acyl-CoA transferase
MSITGDADDEGGHPTKVGVAISDVVTGLYGVLGILAALLDRGPAAGRPGQRVDVSLLASTLSVLVNQAQNGFATGVAPGRRGNAHPNIVPYETFATADGELALAVGSERQWARLCELLERPDLRTDPRFATNGDRVEHHAELRAILAARFAERTVAAWLAALETAEIPAGPIADVVSAFDSPEADALGMRVEIEHPALGVLRQAGVPLRFGRTHGAIRVAPPLLGQDTDRILGALGYEPAVIADLRDRGVV